MALSYRSAIFPGISDGLASHTFPVLNTTAHAGATRDLGGCGPFDLRDDIGDCAIPVAAWKSCSNERRAMALNTLPNPRHHHRQRSNLARETPRHRPDQRLPGWSLHRLSRQCGILPRGLCSDARHCRFKIRFDYDAGHCVANAPGASLDFCPQLQKCGYPEAKQCNGDLLISKTSLRKSPMIAINNIAGRLIHLSCE